MTEKQYDELAETIRSGKVAYIGGRSAASLDELNWIRDNVKDGGEADTGAVSTFSHAANEAATGASGDAGLVSDVDAEARAQTPEMVQQTTPPPGTNTADREARASQLAGMNKADLLKEAEAAGVTGVSDSNTKAEITDAILAQEYPA